MKILAIDPGNVYSAYCIMDADTLKPLEFGKVENEQLLMDILCRDAIADEAVIEMVASYGMAVGKEVFETVFWIGRYYEALSGMMQVDRLYRLEEKQHICHDSRAKDSNIRQALIDRFATHDLKNGRGTKKDPDFFYGFAADIWAAYAVGLTYIETKMKG